MTVAYWRPNGQTIAQVDQIAVTAVMVGGTLTATINGKTVVYTCVTGDTTSTAASNWQALLANSASAPPEFGEITWSVSGAVITATAATPGTPFTVTTSSAGGATLSQTHPTASSSPSDVNNPANWLRGGSPALPQNGDDVVVSDSAIPLLWNLDALAAVQFATFKRYQTFTATIGLPDVNQTGYIEYRPTYFAFAGPAGALPITLGIGAGTGPTRERYNVGSQRTALTVLASGSAADEFAVRFLGTHASNTVSLVGTTLGVAVLPSEVATIASATVDGGGDLTCGPGVTFSGALSLTAGSADLLCVPGSITAVAGSTLTFEAPGGTLASLDAEGGTNVTWLSGTTITTLTLRTGSTFDKSGDLRAVTVTNATIDGDSCVISDPNSVIAWTNPVTVNGAVTGGPFVYTGRTVKIV